MIYRVLPRIRFYDLWLYRLFYCRWNSILRLRPYLLDRIIQDMQNWQRVNTSDAILGVLKELRARRAAPDTELDQDRGRVPCSKCSVEAIAEELAILKTTIAHEEEHCATCRCFRPTQETSDVVSKAAQQWFDAFVAKYKREPIANDFDGAWIDGYATAIEVFRATGKEKRETLAKSFEELAKVVREAPRSTGSDQ